MSLGTGKTTGFGGRVPGLGMVAKSTAKVENVSLLNGVVTADVVTAVAQETVNNTGSNTRSTQGSSLVGLRVGGVLQPVNTPPNTVIQLPTLGRVILNHQIIPPAGSSAPTQVNGIVVIVTKANSFNLPIGSQIVVAHASANALPFNLEPNGADQAELIAAAEH